MAVASTVILVAVLVVSVVVHEVAHGLVADRLGDSTARMAGRLTLNPLKHNYPFGTLALPFLGALAGVPFGYAKPVPVRPSRLRSPRRDLVLVAFAGPLSNLVLGIAGAVVARGLVPDAPWSFDDLSIAAQFAYGTALVNLLLAVFNALPVPPLDGSRLVEYFLPARWLRTWATVHRYGFVVVLALVVSGSLGFVFDPVLDALEGFVS